MSKALFITHADAGVGGGHLSRSFALSEGLATFGVASSWILNEESAEQAASFGLEDVLFLPDPFTSDIPIDRDARFAVVDSYASRGSFYAAVARRLPLVAIDDLGSLSARGGERFCRILIDYGLTASRKGDVVDAKGAQDAKNTKESVSYLIGPHYTLLRSEFWDATAHEGTYALFVPGAADTAHASEGIVDLWCMDWPPLKIVLGSLVSEERTRNLQAALHLRERGNISVELAPKHFVSLMANAGLVLCTASVVGCEALALEKRTALFRVAGNQDETGAFVAAKKAAFDMGKWEDVSRDTLFEALRFRPDERALKGLVNRRGSIACAGEILRLLDE